jgi:WD40 repeat protein
VSPRLTRELIHPNKSGGIVGIQFSPDGARLIAGDYPGGEIQVWDVATGDQLLTISSGFERRGTAEFFAISPDWKSIYVSREQRQYERIEDNGVVANRWTFDGDIRAWNLETGELLNRWQHAPPRGIFAIQPSRDGKQFLTGERVPGVWEGAIPMSASLFDPDTGTFRVLGEGLYGYGAFSPDNQLVAVSTMDADGYMPALKVFDVASARESLSIPSSTPSEAITISGFSADAQVLIGRVMAYPARGDYSRWRAFLRFWDVQTGRELASLSTVDDNELFDWPGVPSPDESLLAVGNMRGQRPRLYLIDVARHSISHVLELGDNKDTLVRTPAFTPDGKWLAVATQVLPKDTAVRDPAVTDLPQPRIHLIEAAAGEIRETLVSPQCFAISAAFSPDGQTLATSGDGRVLLWDLTSAPGARPKSPE